MFEVDFADFDAELSEKKPVNWVVKTTAPIDRQTLKQQRRGDGRGNSKKSGKSQSHNSVNQSNGEGRRSYPARAARTLERRRRHAEEQVRHKNEPKDPNITWLPAEDEEGNVEYKLRLKDPGAARLECLITQMKFRLAEGQGDGCFYYVGVEDGGYPRGLNDNDLRLSLNNLNYMASALKSTATIARLFQGASGRSCALVQVRRDCIEDVHYLEMRIAVGGSVGSGKSSLVAVLTHGVDGEPLLDDGRGRARTAVFRHKHEIQSGHTSSISQSMLGYDSSGNVLNYLGVSSLTATEISAAAQKVLHFIDLTGHSRFLRTALYGLTSLLPDCLMFCVCAHTGVNRTAREHLAAALALDIPVFAVVTKTDQADDDMLAATLLETRLLLATAADTATDARVVDGGLAGHTTDDTTDVEFSTAADLDGGVFSTDDDVARNAERTSQAQQARLDKRVPVVDTEEQAAAVAQLMCILQQHHHPLLCRSYMVPCFLTSSTTGMGIPLLHRFLRGLQQAPRRKQPVDVSRRRRLFESYNGRVAPGIPNPPAYAWPRPPPARTMSTPPTRSTSQHSTHSSASQSSNTPREDVSRIYSTGPLSPASPQSLKRNSPILDATNSSPGEENADTVQDERTGPEGSPWVPTSSSAVGDFLPATAMQTRRRTTGSTGRVSSGATQSFEAQADVPSPTGQGAQQSSGVPTGALAHFQIDHMFEISKVGMVFSGTVVQGNIELGSVLWWGPHETSGEFSLVTVKGIHRSRVPVSRVAAGQCATIAIDQQISRAPSGITFVRQVGAATHSIAEGGELLLRVPSDSGMLLARKRMSEPGLLGSTRAASSQGCSTDREELDVMPVELPSDPPKGNDSFSVRRSFSEVSGADASVLPRIVINDTQGFSPAASPRADSPVVSSPLAREYGNRGFGAAEPLPLAQNAELSQAAAAINTAAVDSLGVDRKQASDLQDAAVCGPSSCSAVPRTAPGWVIADSSQQRQQQQSRIDAAQEQSLAVSFSDALGVSSWPGGPGEGNSAAANDQHTSDFHPLSGDSPLAFAGFSNAHPTAEKYDTPGDVASGSQELLGSSLEGRGGHNISLSLDPTGGFADAATPHLGSPDLSNRVPLPPTHDDAGASTSKAPPGGNEGDTAEACFLQTQAPEEGQLEVSKVLQGRSTSGSDMNPNTGSLDEGGRASPVEAMMGGLSVRASSPILPASLSPVHGQQPLSGEALKRLSETLPQQVQMSASPDAFGLGDASWHHVGLQLAGLPTGEAESTAATKGRKGTVMLDNRMEPHAVMEASAFMILTNGQWPPRGLLSGRWPPEDEDPGSPIQAQQIATDAPVLDNDVSARRKQRTKYRHIIHCGSVRQEVEIDSIQEIPVDLKKERFEVDGVNLSAASAAAAILVADAGAGADDEGGNEAHEDELIGAVVDVTFRFRKPEWLIPGLRFVLRDQNGGVSAAGVIRSVPVK